MKRLFTLLVILGFAVWAGISIASDPGYMLLAYKHWTLETPLWFGIILWLLFAGLIILIASIWRDIGTIGARWHAWRSWRKLTRSNNLSVRSLLETIEGYYDSAEKNVLKALSNAEIPLMNYLIAAYCAHALSKTEARDKYFEEAKNLAPEAEVAIQLLKIDWLMAAEQFTQAQIELELLLQEDPHQQRALVLAQTLYSKLGAWDDLLKTAQLLRKRKIINQEAYEALQSKAYAAKLAYAAEKKDIKILNTCWFTIPSQYQTQPELVLIYTKALIEQNNGIPAAELLRDCLKKFWDDDLVYQYGFSVTPKPEEQIKNAEKWLTDHPQDAMLLLTLGRLCIHAGLFGKAKSYLETSVTIAARPETYLALAELNTRQANFEQASLYYAKGLQLALEK